MGKTNSGVEDYWCYFVNTRTSEQTQQDNRQPLVAVVLMVVTFYFCALLLSL